jgi:hypothetical protein
MVADGGHMKNEQSEHGENLVEQLVNEDPSRKFPIVEKETEWRTFWDIDPTPFESIYTGIKAAALKGHWMDLGVDGHILPH